MKMNKNLHISDIYIACPHSPISFVHINHRELFLVSMKASLYRVNAEVKIITK